MTLHLCSGINGNVGNNFFLCINPEMCGSQVATHPPIVVFLRWSANHGRPGRFMSGHSDETSAEWGLDKSLKRSESGFC